MIPKPFNPFELVRTFTIIGIPTVAVFGFIIFKSTPVQQSTPEIQVKASRIPVVLQQVSDIGILATAQYEMVATVPVQQTQVIDLPGGFLSLPYGQGKVNYSGAVRVTAGLDFSKVQLDANRPNTIWLPAPEISFVETDERNSQVNHSSYLGFGGDNTADLTLKAQEIAKQRAITAACQRGIEERARRRAEEIVVGLFQKIGESVIVEFDGVGTCNSQDSDN